MQRFRFQAAEFESQRSPRGVMIPRGRALRDTR